VAVVPAAVTDRADGDDQADQDDHEQDQQVQDHRPGEGGVDEAGQGVWDVGDVRQRILLRDGRGDEAPAQSRFNGVVLVMELHAGAGHSPVSCPRTAAWLVSGRRWWSSTVEAQGR
jgi:hypothetical protein